MNTQEDARKAYERADLATPLDREGVRTVVKNAIQLCYTCLDLDCADFKCDGETIDVRGLIKELEEALALL